MKQTFAGRHKTGSSQITRQFPMGVLPADRRDEELEATLFKWRNRHDTCLRADRGALTQMDRTSFKAAQQ